MKLPARLEAALSLIPHGAIFADIGTDHGYLPVQAVLSGTSAYAIAADIGRGPLDAAIGHVRGEGLEGRIDCRLGDGLTCIRPHEVDGAIICGMGGSLICRILEQSEALWQSFSFVVLQPQSDSGALRNFLYDHGWHIDDERLVVEDGRLYELMRAVPGKEEALPGWLCDVGPVNWQRKDALLERRIDDLIHRANHILTGLRKSRHDVSGRIAALEQEIHEWEERKWQ